MRSAVIIADDHAIFRDGLKLLLAMQPEFQVVAECGTLDALLTLVQQHQPQLVLMDYNMPGGNALATLQYLRQRYPALRLVMLTAERGGQLLAQVQQAGADGLLLKEGSAADMLAALQQVMAGQRVISPAASALMQDSQVALTTREYQVLQLICQGWPHADIAAHFSLSVRTVDKHRENLQRKLGASNAVQLINRARALQLFHD
jgi:DNA-binding NarL/FixJ family response regulator